MFKKRYFTLSKTKTMHKNNYFFKLRSCLGGGHRIWLYRWYEQHKDIDISQNIDNVYNISIYIVFDSYWLSNIRHISKKRSINFFLQMGPFLKIFRAPSGDLKVSYELPNHAKLCRRVYWTRITKNLKIDIFDLST